MSEQENNQDQQQNLQDQQDNQNQLEDNSGANELQQVQKQNSEDLQNQNQANQENNENNQTDNEPQYLNTEQNMQENQNQQNEKKNQDQEILNHSHEKEKQQNDEQQENQINDEQGQEKQLQQQNQKQEQQLLQQQQQQNVQQQQQKMHQKMFKKEEFKKLQQQRKQQGFEQWDTTRSQFLENHQKILNKLLQEIEIRHKISDNFTDNLMNFLNLKIQQEMNFINSQEFSLNLPKNSDASELMFNHFSNHLIKLQQKISQRIQKSQKFVSEIKDQIFVKILNPFLNESKQKLNDQYHITEILNKQLKKNQQIAAKKCMKVSQIYQAQSEEKSILNTKQNKDLYKAVLGFLRAADQQKDSQRNIARHVLKIYKLTIDIEIKKQQVIQDVIFTYQQAFEECYGLQDDLEQLVIQNSEQYIQKAFELNKLLGEQTCQQVQKLLGEQPEKTLNFQDFQIYLEEFTIAPFEERQFVIKNMQIQREIGPNQFQDTKFVISIDGYLLCHDIYEDSENSHIHSKYPKTQFMLKLSKPSVKQITDIVVDIKNKENFFLKVFEQGNRNRFKFNCVEEIEEFKRITSIF
ncbi:hypothetical protein PPERSA_04463 [Pseudocohnilembus persalinus]|uniref:Uncharacterized protein n=1 Tax=Pseudocohnilembus persalinus TaxID=266149 RepID=A0A0V0QRK7_PSEPJ|nr:hypothetical protein PPERSA_04463 [Pseudocohnilembus persalinus]|eukprot:KRX04648.1 hypothetical protein PPERSA_04463 [Pseudocohnilembus persalinus]